MSVVSPPPVGPDLKVWARQITAFLARALPRLQFKTTTDSAAENGVLLWDDTVGHPVVSKNGEWRQVVLSDGQYDGIITANVVAGTINTALPLTFTQTITDGISNGTPPSRLVFAEGGRFMASFSAQISSTSASTVLFYFWPRINGVDAQNSTMVAALHQNNATTVVSRAIAFEVSAGDYLEAMWATTNAAGYLQATPATAFSPVAPAATLTITRLYA